jgi:hypothetical protein
MKWFFVYSVVAFVGLLGITILGYISSTTKSLAIGITLFSTFVHYFLLSFFFSRIFIRGKSRISFLLILFCSVPFLIMIVNQNISDLNARVSFFFVNFCLLLFCILYYYQLFKFLPKGNLLAQPSFWIVSGIFFSMGITIPFYSVTNYLKATLASEVFSSLNSIGLFAYGVMHLFFIKAYICSLVPKKT